MKTMLGGRAGWAASRLVVSASAPHAAVRNTVRRVIDRRAGPAFIVPPHRRPRAPKTHATMAVLASRRGAPAHACPPAAADCLPDTAGAVLDGAGAASTAEGARHE